MLDRKISIAPMMNCTDKHDRYFMRLIAPHVLLYTEMVTTGALIHGDTNRFLSFHPFEHPIALQLGGSDPSELAHCAKLAEKMGYNEVNLNVGCPSDRVQSGKFGACLMLTPELVADCVSAMHESVSIPVTVKCRIGVDEQDSYSALCSFIQKISEKGCDVFIVHARKAWLKGLSPKENREIPPLQYDVVYKLKKDFPNLTIIINGGVKTLDEVQAHLQCVDGVMIGREAYSNPYLLSSLEKTIFGFEGENHTRREIVEKFIPYIEAQLHEKVKLSSITRHILGLFQGQVGARIWRRFLSENSYKKGVGVEVVRDALNEICRDM